MRRTGRRSGVMDVTGAEGFELVPGQVAGVEGVGVKDDDFHVPEFNHG